MAKGYVVPVQATVEVGICVNAETPALAIAAAQEYIRKNYDAEDSMFLAGKFIKGTAVVPNGKAPVETGAPSQGG